MNSSCYKTQAHSLLYQFLTSSVPTKKLSDYATKKKLIKIFTVVGFADNYYSFVYYGWDCKSIYHSFHNRCSHNFRIRHNLHSNHNHHFHNLHTRHNRCILDHNHNHLGYPSFDYIRLKITKIYCKKTTFFQRFFFSINNKPRPLPPRPPRPRGPPRTIFIGILSGLGVAFLTSTSLPEMVCLGVFNNSFTTCSESNVIKQNPLR